MVVDKLFEFIEDIERFCVNHKWSRFFNDWETGDEALDEYAMIYKNCCNDVDEEKDAANDIFTELTEYMDCLYNYIDVDYVKLLDDEKQNARKWLDKVEKVIGSCVFSLKGNDLKGFLIKGYQMCHLIKEAAVKTPDEYYGGRRTDVMPYYLGENKEQLFDNILNESIDDAGYALTKLKGYLNFNIRWEYDGDGVPYLVDDENEPPLYTVQWIETESGSRQGYYSVEVEQDEEWDSTIYNFSDVRSTYQKIEDVMKSSKLLEGKGDFKRYAMLGGAAAAVLGLGALKVGDIKDIKSKADELNIKVPAIEYVSSHRDAQLVRPIYDYKYDNKGPLDIESLCKWLERHTEFENVWYEEDGDNYTIKYRNSYYSYADDSSNPKRKTTYGKLDLPKSYFDDWTYSLDENKKKALFDKLLKE